MNVGILTFHKTTSYGAQIQAWALSKYLEGLGHRVTVIDYMPPHRSMRLLPAYPFGLRRWLAPVKAVRTAKEVISARKQAWVHLVEIENLLNLSGQQYQSFQDLESSAIDLDVCVLGSDQIWSPKKTGGAYDPAYFGLFGAKDMRCVAYAPSFGSATDGLPPPKEYLDNVDYVSVRERRGVDFIQPLCNKPVKHVLDPTLLHGLAGFPFPKAGITCEKFVFGYLLGDPKFGRSLLANVSRLLGFSCLDLSQPGVSFGNPTPTLSEVLEYVRSSQFVVTNSFHGTALSIIFRKPFVTVALEWGAETINDRMTDLLELAGLPERFLVANSAISSTELLNPINWDSVERNLRPHRQRSEVFLQEALGD